MIFFLLRNFYPSIIKSHNFLYIFSSYSSYIGRLMINFVFILCLIFVKCNCASNHAIIPPNNCFFFVSFFSFILISSTRDLYLELNTWFCVFFLLLFTYYYGINLACTIQCNTKQAHIYNFFSGISMIKKSINS